MNIKLKIEDNTTLKGYEVQDLVAGSIDISTSLFDSVGKLEFDLVKIDNFTLSNGNTVYLDVDGVGIFKGYIFKYTITDKDTIRVTCYDQLRYLKIKDTLALEAGTASDVF